MARRRITIIVALVFALAAALSALGAWALAGWVEQRSRTAADRALELAGADWARVEADGLLLVVAGTAPDEQSRFKAMRALTSLVAPSHLVDRIEVRPAEGLTPPRFSVEILRGAAGVSAIGLIPADSERAEMTRRLARAAGGARVTDLLQTADWPTPEGWDVALDYALRAVAELPRAKVSARPGHVTVSAVLDSAEAKDRLAVRLSRMAPAGLEVALDLRAPRPVVTPFAFRAVLEEGAVRVDSCVADTPAARARILAALGRLGRVGNPRCRVAIGAPSAHWADAVTRGLEALGQLGAGTLTLSDTTLTLEAPAAIPGERIEAARETLETGLPELFTPHVRQEKPGDGQDETQATSARLVAVREPDGLLAATGNIPADARGDAIRAAIRARFGSEGLTLALRPAERLPPGWTPRVLAGFEALSEIRAGTLRVSPESVLLSGRALNREEISRATEALARSMPEGADYDVDVTVDPSLAPPSDRLEPQACVKRLNAILKADKITFAPGSASIDASAARTLSRLAEVMEKCEHVPMEIAGHTDSQGRAEMNLALSQARAQAVLDALLARGVLTSNLVARGYGETRPIADNGTEEGREANRRIEFALIPTEGAGEGSSAPAPEGAPGEPMAGQAAGGAAEAEGKPPATGRTSATKKGENQ